MKIVKMDLSSQSIKDLVKKLEDFKKDIKQADKKIVKELSDLGLKEIQANYATTPYKDGNEDVGFFTAGNDDKRTIGVVGTQVLYNEFGTGTAGEMNPHEDKGKFSLNPYNNRVGTTIRENKIQDSEASKHGIPVGGLYWTYMNNGEKQYTQGIPAGKQVYLAAKTIEKEKTRIIKKVVGDALSKL